MSQKYTKITTILLVAALMQGCAGLNGKFGCKASATNSCTTVSKVNSQADAGYFSFKSSGGDDAQHQSQTFAYDTGYKGYTGTTPAPGEPVRFGEQVQRIWIAPYQDRVNNYHEPSYIYTVLNKPHWIGSPAREIRNSELGVND
jgi:type IV conjugative transfer system lipoprotein TraV